MDRRAVPHDRWAPPPPASATSLLEQDVRPAGRAPEIDTAVAVFGADDIRQWRRSRVEDAVRFTTPRLPRDLDAITSLRLRARMGGATRVRVVPHVASPASADNQRLQRAVEVPVEPAAREGDTVGLAFPLTDVMRDTWDDVKREGWLLGLEIDFVGAEPGQVRLERVALEGALAPFSGAAVGQRVVAVGDVLQPALFVHPGSRARIAVKLPEGRPELRWNDGTIGGAGARSITLIHGTKSFTLESIEQGAAGSWRPRTVSLQRWAGREVTLELATGAGPRPGVGLFANPTIVAGDLPQQTPDVILYMIDTLRADHVGAYAGASESATPTLDRLAAEGVVFERVLSSSSWTKPAIPTLLTGIWPTTHRVGATANTDRLPASVPMLQERFAAGGWRAGSFTANPLGSTLSGLERGFDTTYPPRFWQGRVGRLGHPSADQLHDALLGWIDEQPDRPLFAYVHTVEVHEYHQPLYRRGGSDGDGYVAAVRDADRKLGRLLDGLRSRGRDRNLLLVVVSDHGESLGEHGLVGHGMSLYQQELHVPLIVWAGESIPEGRVSTIASLADVAPTLAALCGLEPLRSIDGVALAASVGGGDAPERPFVPAALLRVLWRIGAPKEYAVLTASRTKLIRTEGGPLRAFDLSADPGEKAPLPRAPAGAVRALDGWVERERREADAFRDTHGPIGSTELDRDTADRLRALGYMK
jgi:arylsulfatase A-like enzyme